MSYCVSSCFQDNYVSVGYNYKSWKSRYIIIRRCHNIAFVPNDLIVIAFVPNDLIAFVPNDLISFMPNDRIAFVPYDLIAFVPNDLIAFVPYDLISFVPNDHIAFVPNDHIAFVFNDRIAFVPNDRIAFMPNDRIAFLIFVFLTRTWQNVSNSPSPLIVRGLTLQKHHDCSYRSTSTNFGPGLDMTIIYQFLEGAKMGSLCGSHVGQIQDGRHPE